MDPLSDIVSLLRPHDCVAAGLDAGGDWAIRFERHAGMKCNAVLKGACWLRVEGMGEAVRLDTGDCAILPHGAPFVLSANRGRAGDGAAAIYAPVPHGGTAVHGGGGDFFMTGSRFLLSGPAGTVLLGQLPAVIHVRPGPSGDAVGWALSRIADELQGERPGGALAIAHLAHLVFLQVLRRHLEEAPPATSGWLAALGDPHLSKAVAAMHADPARPWTVQALASRAGLSRTAFAVRFRRVAGEAPIGYLTRLRMLRAAARLGRPGMSTARIAEEAGYASESAFAVAFKRVTGQPPRRYARELSGRPAQVPERVPDLSSDQSDGGVRSRACGEHSAPRGEPIATWATAR